MNAVEWVAESDWSKVPRGRRIQLRSGAGFIEGVSLHSDYESLLVGYKSEGIGQRSRREYKHCGWELFTEKPSVVLPTEPGVYVGSLMPYVPMWLNSEGQWYTVKTRCHEPERHAPFTRLEPVAETANRIADWIDEAEWSWGKGVNPIVTRAVRAEFGVSAS